MGYGRREHLDSALSFPYSLECDLEIPIPMHARELLSPFDQQDAVRGDEIVERESFEFALGFDAI